jgi:hypothetical protein
VEAVTPVAIVVVLLIVGAIFFVVARRILRLAVKLALAMAVVSALVITAGFGWWRGWFETTKKNRIPATTTNKRAPPANRSPR